MPIILTAAPLVDWRGGQIGLLLDITYHFVIHIRGSELMRHATSIGLGLVALFLTLAATKDVAAGVDVFTEDFTTSSANWANYNSTGFLTHVPSGGPDGGAFATGPRSFLGQAAGNTPVALRARHDDPWNSSGDAFARNWVTDGIRQVSAWVKHDVPSTNLQFFTRVAGPANFPGHVYGSTNLVVPDTWTKIVFDVSKLSPQLVSAEGSDWETVLGNVGHLQFGAVVPAGFDANDTFFNLSIDKVTVSTPEPASATLAVIGIIGALALSGRCARRSRCATE